MATLTDLTATDNFADNKKPLLTDLREHTGSIVTYINDTIKDNLQQLALDSFPTGYAFNSDGAKQFTSGIDLFQKQNAAASYTGGNIAISTTGSWTDVDASNAKITFTPNHLAGDFSVSFQFNISAVTTNATNEVLVRFRLTDGSTTSTAIANVHQVTGVNATTNVKPVYIKHVFTSLAASSQTVKLQYFITTLTAVTLNVLANSNSPIVATAEKV